MDPEEWWVPCACVQVYHTVRLNTHTWYHLADSMLEIDFQAEKKDLRLKFNFQISKLNLRFQVNLNRFSRDTGFEHM